MLSIGHEAAPKSPCPAHSGEVKVKAAQLCLTLCNYMDCSPWNSPGQNTGVGSLSLLQGIFPTQGSNPGLPHCRQILYQLSCKGSPRILEWSLSLLLRIFLTQELNWGLLHCRQILYQLSYQGSHHSGDPEGNSISALRVGWKEANSQIIITQGLGEVHRSGVGKSRSL